jgi:hypothetical protein
VLINEQEDSMANPDQAGLLPGRLVALAATPDDSSQVGTELIIVAQVAARVIAPVDHASVTVRFEDTYATMAASSDVAVALDRAQYADLAGPCLEALEADYPAAVPDIAATLTWPGFRDAAAGFGLQSSLSIPLFAGSGRTIASLNLYSHEIGTMATLTSAVWAAYDPEVSEGFDHAALDPGGRELIAGLFSAVALRNLIQRAVALIMVTTERSFDYAYLSLCTRAVEAGVSLIDAATQIIEDQDHRGGKSQRQ